VALVVPWVQEILRQQALLEIPVRPTILFLYAAVMVGLVISVVVRGRLTSGQAHRLLVLLDRITEVAVAERLATRLQLLGLVA
jgi:hypothetical protein